MKQYASINLFFILIVTIVACNVPKESILPKKNIKPTEEISSQTQEKSPNFDPYFVESTAITSSTGPVSITRNILEDSKGMIWLATWEGIIQYDGNTFTNFTNKDSLSRFHVFAVLEDKKGNLWFGTIGGGLLLYNGKTFTNLTVKDGLVSNSVACFYEDNTGKIWIGTQDGISIYNGKSFTNFTTNNGLTDNDVNSIIQDKIGRFWIGTRGEACFYDGTIFSRCLNDEGESFVNVRSIVKDKKENIWLGGNDGLLRYTNGTFTNINKNFTGYIYEDKKGNIWTSSASATNYQQWELTLYDEKYLRHEIITANSILKKEAMFFGILADKLGGIWLGTVNGVCRYDGETFNYFKEK